MSLPVFAASAIAVFALDRASKWLALDGLGLREALRIDVAPGLFALRMAWNRGVNFGLFASDAALAQWLLIALALAISAAVSAWALTRGGALAAGGAGLLVGGALGNALDRAIWGAVADFLNVTCCGVENPWSFNVADVAIFAGALVVALAPPRASGDGALRAAAQSPKERS